LFAHNVFCQQEMSAAATKLCNFRDYAHACSMSN
jgi:hypothetical protein